MNQGQGQGQIAWSFIYYFHGIYPVRISGMFLLRSIAGVVVSTEACGL